MSTESDRLLSELQLLSERLQTSLYERSTSEKSRCSTCDNELEEVIECLQTREKELSAVLDIAIANIEKYSASAYEIEVLTNEIQKTDRREQDLKEEVDNLKRNLAIANGNYNKVSLALLESEKTIGELEQQNQKLIAEAEMQATMRADEESEKSPEKLPILDDENVGYLTRKVEKLKKKLSLCQNQLDQSEELRQAAEVKANSAEAIAKKLRSNISKLTKEVERLSAEADENAMRAKHSELETSNLFEKLTGLEEELNLPVHTPKKKKPKITNFSSLDDELLEIGAVSKENKFEQSIDEIVFNGNSSPSNLTTTNLTMYFTPSIRRQGSLTELETDSRSVAEIKTRRKTDQTRKSASEEFFYLTAQSVKMNSPHMDMICTVSTQELYIQAQKEKIPFHKWYHWLEIRLAEQYLYK